MRFDPHSFTPRQTVRRCAPEWQLLLASIVLGILVGCSGSEAKLAPVEGVARLDGQPLTEGIVTFQPKSGRSATGAIQSDGTFQLGTYSGSDGALIGTHKVSVTAAGSASRGRPNFETDNPRASAKSSPLPARYSSPDTSGIEFEVKSGAANHAEIELSSN